MAKHIIRVGHIDTCFRIVIPRAVISARRWEDVDYLLVDDRDPNKLVLRRFLDGESLRDDD